MGWFGAILVDDGVVFSRAFPTQNRREARRRLGLAAALPLLAVAAGCGVGAEHAGAAVTVADRAGALFTPVSSGFHSCSGVVIHSARRDLVATAAHCMIGTGKGYLFAPGYADGPATGTSNGDDAGHAPFGSWRVTSAWVDPHWKPHGNPAYDLAILAVQPQKRAGKVVKLEDVVPGATLAHAAPSAGTAITPVGYPLGHAGVSVSCHASVTLTGASPTFACPGFIDGTSGGPWFTAGSGGRPGVAGLVSGLHQGGCTPDISYATPLGKWSNALLARAVAGKPGDTVQAPPGDGC